VKGLRRYAMTLVAVASLVTIVLLVTGWGAAWGKGLATPFRNVVVTNTSANPVPVQATGTLEVQATGTVPVHEQGTASVNVTNTSVPVHEQGIASVQQAGTPTTVHFSNLTTYTVPAGKRLVIEYVSGYADVSGYIVLEVIGGGTSANHTLPTQDASTEFVNRWVTSEQVTIFAGPGAELEASAGTDAQLTAVGYMFDA